MDQRQPNLAGLDGDILIGEAAGKRRELPPRIVAGHAEHAAGMAGDRADGFELEIEGAGGAAPDEHGKGLTC